MSDKRKYYASVTVTLTADREFKSIEERDKYLANISEDVLETTNSLYDRVDTRIEKSNGYTGLTWNRPHYPYHPDHYRYTYARTEEDEEE